MTRLSTNQMGGSQNAAKLILTNLQVSIDPNNTALSCEVCTVDAKKTIVQSS
jgi:hypothetical protein